MGNPLTHKNQEMLQTQIHSIKFLDGTPIKYLPPNKSYKMLGVHINTVLDFKEHLAHITKDVRLLAKALARRNLSPPYKTLIIEQLLKSKFHATHLGVFTDPQLTEIDRILNKALRLATGIIHNFPTEGVQRPSKEMGMGLPSIRERATQMGIEHLLNNMNKDTERGYLAYSHTHRILTQFNQWPTEAL